MTNYKEYQFFLTEPDKTREVITALLSNAGFEGFVETEDGFLGYANQKVPVDDILSNFNRSYTYQVRTVPEENWNAQWEKQIKPLEIGNQIYIKTSFHPEKKFPLVVTIDPKMSFGTGHHETTYLMIQQLMELDLKDQSVIDMGAGTGVLSIIAFKYGAQPVYAVDNDKWAYKNMLENFEKNNTPYIQSFLGDATSIKDFPQFDIFLANINRNILLRDMSVYVPKIKSGGLLILSGFYNQDIPLIEQEARKNGMIFEKKKEKNQWVSLTFKKNI